MKIISKRQALAFAKGEHLLPVALDIESAETLGEIRQVDLRQELQQLIIRHDTLGLRIEELRTQGTQQHVRLLRQEEDAAGLRMDDGTAAAVPKAGDRAQQRTLAAATLADDHQARAGLDDQRQIANQDALPTWRLQGHALKA